MGSVKHDDERWKQGMGPAAEAIILGHDRITEKIRELEEERAKNDSQVLKITRGKGRRVHLGRVVFQTPFWWNGKPRLISFCGGPFRDQVAMIETDQEIDCKICLKRIERATQFPDRPLGEALRAAGFGPA